MDSQCKSRQTEASATRSRIRAAIAGQGIALVRDVYAADELASGRLALVLDRPWPTAFAYYPVTAPDVMSCPPVRTSLDWPRGGAAAGWGRISGSILSVTALPPCERDAGYCGSVGWLPGNRVAARPEPIGSRPRPRAWPIRLRPVGPSSRAAPDRSRSSGTFPSAPGSSGPPSPGFPATGCEPGRRGPF